MRAAPAHMSVFAGAPGDWTAGKHDHIAAGSPLVRGITFVTAVVVTHRLGVAVAAKHDSLVALTVQVMDHMHGSLPGSLRRSAHDRAELLHTVRRVGYSVTRRLL